MQPDACLKNAAAGLWPVGLCLVMVSGFLPGCGQWVSAGLCSVGLCWVMASESLLGYGQ